MSRRRSLWPREHGAYFQLAIPLLTACLLHTPTAAMIALVVAAALALLAYEPLLVVLGHRGPRRTEIDGPRARPRLAWLVGGVVALGIAGLVTAPPGAVAVAALVAVPVTLVVALACRRTERTLVGELVAAIGLTGASIPVLVAGGTPRVTALAVWLGWSVGFGASVLAVHRVLARHKHPASAFDRVLAVGLVATLAACIGWASRVAPLAIAAPLVGLAAIVVISPPAASRLRAIGIAIVAAAIAASVIALAGAV